MRADRMMWHDMQLDVISRARYATLLREAEMERLAERLRTDDEPGLEPGRTSPLKTRRRLRAFGWPRLSQRAG